MNLASNYEFAQVFQAIVFVLHSTHHLHGVAIAILLHIGRDIMSAHVSCNLLINTSEQLP